MSGATMPVSPAAGPGPAAPTAGVPDPRTTSRSRSTSMPVRAPPAMSQGTRSADRAVPAAPAAAPRPRPHAEQNRASGEHAEPQEGQKPGADEGIVAI